MEIKREDVEEAIGSLKREETAGGDGMEKGDWQFGGEMVSERNGFRMGEGMTEETQTYWILDE